jgi:putative membrane protein
MVTVVDTGAVTTSSQRRRPGWVYDEGEEPDARYSLANERTFLAWIRTALAVLAAGVALGAVHVNLSERLQEVLADALVLVSAACAATAWLRWAQVERAMRCRRPLPALGPSAALVAVALVAVGLVLLVAVP